MIAIIKDDKIEITINKTLKSRSYLGPDHKANCGICCIPKYRMLIDNSDAICKSCYKYTNYYSE